MDVVLYVPRGPRIIYPDYWNGPAAYKSDIYPDNWNGPAAYTDCLYPDRYRPPSSCQLSTSSSSSALTLQLRATNTMDPNEEAFHARIRALRDLEELEGPSGSRYKDSFDYARGVGPRNRRPLGPKVSAANVTPLGKIRRRHSSVEKPRQTRSTSKQFKLEPQSSSKKIGKQTVIDLTSDDDTPTQPVRQTTPHQALQVTTNRASPSAMEISRTPPPKDSRILPIRPANIPTPTTAPSNIKLDKPCTVRRFAKVAARLRHSQEAVQQDKRTLSKCWEVDKAMQGGKVWERLQALNEHYRVAEEALEAALGVVEGLI